MDPVVAAIGWVEFAIILGVALAISNRKLREANLPRIALLSAGIFVAQMINFPVGGGTTGHLIGGALLAIIAGPALAIIGMSVVIIIQALMFGDGGVTALGLNATNMAIIAPVMGWSVYRLTSRVVGDQSTWGKSVAVALAAWASVFVAAAACTAELLVSYAISAGDFGIAAPISVPAMLAYHAVIGLGEAATTVGLMTYLAHVSPETLRIPAAIDKSAKSPGIVGRETLYAAAAIVLVFALVLPLYIVYASEGRDGLEQVVSESGAEDEEPLLNAPFSYGESYFELLLAGILGFLGVALAALVLLRVFRREERIKDASDGTQGT